MTKPKDRRLDRLPEFDDESRNYPIAAMLPRAAFKPRSYRWQCPICLDQGNEGACVGFGWSHELAARPDKVPDINYDSAFKLYKTAQTLDPWPGQDYSGTSVLAGAKATMQLYPSHLLGYRWAFGIEEVIATLGYFGPVVLGLHWYDDMFTPDKDGYIHVGGQIAGGHCILARGVNVVGKFVILHNSWGSSFGIEGDCRITFSDLSVLLKQEGEACVPIRKYS